VRNGANAPLTPSPPPRPEGLRRRELEREPPPVGPGLKASPSPGAKIDPAADAPGKMRQCSGEHRATASVVSRRRRSRTQVGSSGSDTHTQLPISGSSPKAFQADSNIGLRSAAVRRTAFVVANTVPTHAVQPGGRGSGSPPCSVKPSVAAHDRGAGTPDRLRSKRTRDGAAPGGCGYSRSNPFELIRLSALAGPPDRVY
jgi:hypothetical protein